MKALLLAIAFLALSSSMFANTITLNCTPSGGNGNVGSSVLFNNAAGAANFHCTDSSLGPVVLSGITMNISTDYTAGNGTNTDPNDNSAGFRFSNFATTWGSAQAGAFTSTMALSSGSGLTVFTIGNRNSLASTFTNAPSGGLGGTSFIQPTTDTVTGALFDTLDISLTAFVDAGGFTNGLSDASVSVTYTYTPVVVPEPTTMAFFVSGLLGIALLGLRRRLHGSLKV